MDGFVEWPFEGDPKCLIGQNIVFYDQISRRHREPNPLSIRHVWMYMIEWTIRQIEWYRDNKILLPSQIRDYLWRFFYTMKREHSIEVLYR